MFMIRKLKEPYFYFVARELSKKSARTEVYRSWLEDWDYVGRESLLSNLKCPLFFKTLQAIFRPQILPENTIILDECQSTFKQIGSFKSFSKEELREYYFKCPTQGTREQDN